MSHGAHTAHDLGQAAGLTPTAQGELPRNLVLPNIKARRSEDQGANRSKALGCQTETLRCKHTRPPRSPISGAANDPKGGAMFILTEQTPNPDALKFIPQQALTSGAVGAFRRDSERPCRSPLADRMFALDGVIGVFITAEFLTLTRAPDGPPWSQLRYQALAALADHIASCEPALIPAVAETAISDDDIEDEIRTVLGLYVSPGVARDGGDVVFDHFDHSAGVLWIEMRGACGGCPSSQLTLKATIEALVRRYVPEVRRVEEIAAPPQTAPIHAKSWAERLAGAKGPGVRPLFTRNGRPWPSI